jgi:aminoglycoside/choline kinase family phosphotransferase
VRPASADASFRRYLRVDGAQGSRIIMDAPPDKEDCRPSSRSPQLMADAGLLVPRVLAWDEPQGFMLLDDLGTQTMIEVVDPQQPAANLPLYLRAVDALIAWQLASRPGVLPAYDEPCCARAGAVPRLVPEAAPRRHASPASSARRWTASSA